MLNSVVRIKLKNNDRSNYMKISNFIHQKKVQRSLANKLGKYQRGLVYLICKTFMQTVKKDHKIKVKWAKLLDNSQRTRND